MKTNHDFKVRILDTAKGRVWVVIDQNKPVAFLKRKKTAMKFMERKTKERERWTMK